MNAIALDNNGDVVDPFDGCADIRQGIDRAVGSARDRFKEDALRIMRAIRFRAVFDFEIDMETYKAIMELYPLLDYVSKERINTEWVKIANTSHFFGTMIDFKEVFQHILGISDWNYCPYLEGEDLITKLSGFFNDIKDAQKVLYDLKFDGDTRRKVIELVGDKDKELTADRINIRRWLSVRDVEQVQRLAILKQMDITSIISDVAHSDCYTIKDLALNGYDVGALGYKDKEIGIILNKLLDAVILDKVTNTKEELINYIEKELSL